MVLIKNGYTIKDIPTMTLKFNLKMSTDHSFKLKIIEYSISYTEEFYNYVRDYPLNKFEYNNNSFYIKQKEDQELLKQVDTYVKPIADEHNSVLDNTWIQHYDKGHFHDLHIHGSGEFLSFIWYIDCTENSSSTTFFNQGYPYIETHKLIIKPKKNKFILFDGTIPHLVSPNKDTTRLIVSGNLKKSWN